MSAATFGVNLLEEVQEISLDELLYDLRSSLDAGPACLFGIPEIDRLLDHFHHPHKSSHLQETAPTNEAHQNESPARRRPTNLASSENGASRQRPVTVELIRDPSSSAETNILYLITAASILPRKYGGKEATVTWLDTEVHFSATRLHDICVNLLNQTSDPLTPSQKQSIATDALKHVHVFSIPSSKHLLAVLDNLQTYLLQTHTNTQPDPSTHHSKHRPLPLIILNSATSFQWTDRFDLEIAGLTTIKTPTSNPTTTHPPANPPTANQIITKLKSLQTKFSCACIYTTTTPAPSHRYHHRRAQQPSSNRPETPPRPAPNDFDTPSITPWSYAASLSLTVSRVPVPQFASHMSLDECLRDRRQRQEVVDLNRVKVSVNEDWLGTVVRDREVRREVGRMEGRGAFVVRVSGRGVDIER